jgi:hypothetical protein
MVYDWDGKREICYKMYIEDKKALEEIMEYMKNTHQFAPRYVFVEKYITSCRFKFGIRVPQKSHPVTYRPSTYSELIL